MIYNAHLEGDSFLWEGGPAGVVLVHGFTATTAEVRPLAQFLYQQGYTVAGPLLPGHFTRPEDANRCRWRDWVRAVEDAYRQVAARCERVIVGGESMGGLLALYLASDHPEVAAILTYAPALRLRMTWPGAALVYLLASFTPYVRKKNMGNDPLWQGYTVYPLRGTIELLRLQRQVQARLATISRPILIVQGQHDRSVDPGVPEIIYRRVRSPLKELRWMPNSQHCVIIDQEREQVNDITLDFLRRAGA